MLLCAIDTGRDPYLSTKSVCDFGDSPFDLNCSSVNLVSEEVRVTTKVITGNTVHAPCGCQIITTSITDVIHQTRKNRLGLRRKERQLEVCMYIFSTHGMSLYT